MLQTRSAKRSAEAAVRIAIDLVREGLITRDEALMRVDAASLDQLFHARIDPQTHAAPIATGLNASPGAAAGAVVFDPETVGPGGLHTLHDLPAEAPRLFAGATGIEHVLVNGTEVVTGGTLTGAVPGCVLRSGTDTVTVGVPGSPPD